MKDTLRAVADVTAADAKNDGATASHRAPWLDRTGPLFGLFVVVGLIVFAVAVVSVHTGRDLSRDSGAARMHMILSHWLDGGYFHYFGVAVFSTDRGDIIYRSTSGGHLLSAFVVAKLYAVVSGGRYSPRLIGLHNQLVSLVLSALLGLLACRLTRRLGLELGHAAVAGAVVVGLVFTFPENLGLYRLLTGQAYALLFATVFLLVEERRGDGPGTPAQTMVQAAAGFLMTYMEKVEAAAVFATVAAMLCVLVPRRGSWRRFVLVALIPGAAAVALHGLQLYGALRRFPDMGVIGSTFWFRTGFDGESLYYLDHLDIAWRRDWARLNWPANREALFRWPWVFGLGTLSTLCLVAAYVAGRVPRIVVEVLTALIGSWFLYAAVFSQAVVIHPYLYDVLLFTPLALALFALGPALAESLTRRTGAILLIVVLSACWYSMFQMRLYALRYPMPGTQVGAPSPSRGPH